MNAKTALILTVGGIGAVILFGYIVGKAAKSAAENQAASDAKSLKEALGE